MAKLAFDIDVVIERLREVVEPLPKAAMFQLADEGFTTPFEQLIACMISIRTKDETTLPLSRALFARARTPEQMLRLTPDEIDRIIGKSTFHERKAEQMHAIARRVIDEFDGEVPCDQETLISFPGVGIKCANLVLGIACGVPRVSADVHVDRVTNRWGYVSTKTPEQTSKRLEEILPRRYWVEINRLLVPFGKHVCTGSLPKCSTCALLSYCRQVGVEAHR